MKTIAAIFVAIILLVGCAKGQGIVAPTAGVARPTRTGAVITQPMRSPTETPRIAPRRVLTEAVTNPPQDAYPPVMSEPSITPLPPDYPAPRVVENTYTPAPTPTLLTPLEAAQQAWDECKKNEIPPEIAGFQDTRLAGLVFRYWNWLWQIDADGRPTVISCLALSHASPSGRWMTFWLNKAVWVVDRETNVVRSISSNPERYSAPGSWSPDERLYFYSEAENEVETTDIWVWDSITDLSKQITHSPEIGEYSVSVWPAYPDWLLLVSRPRDMPDEPNANGYLTIIRTDGSEEQKITESYNPSFDFSPDGKTLAYNDFYQAWLIQPGVVPEPFLPDQVIEEGWKIKHLWRPDWSPDGTKIAWWAYGEDGIEEYTGIAVYDLEQKKAWFVHPFVHSGLGGWPSHFEWDPSGAWLSIFVQDQDVSRVGFWFVRYDGSEEYHNGLSTLGITWNPAGDHYLYKNTATTKIYLKQVGSWTSMEIGLPYEVVPMLWE